MTGRRHDRAENDDRSRSRRVHRRAVLRGAGPGGGSPLIRFASFLWGGPWWRSMLAWAVGGVILGVIWWLAGGLELDGNGFTRLVDALRFR